LPGVMTDGATREEAIGNTERLAIEVIADRIEHGELPTSVMNVAFEV
jgi:predicted RNase H-like HicB family nuclease